MILQTKIGLWNRLQPFEVYWEWVRTVQKIHCPLFFVFFLFFLELAAAIWGFGNGCGQCKRFTAHCGEANTMVLAFLSVGELCLIEMESFAPFLVDGWLPSWGRHCSKSQNRRKCEGNGSNLQHLKDNWPAGPPPHCWRKVSLNDEWVTIFPGSGKEGWHQPSSIIDWETERQQARKPRSYAS